MGDLSGLPAGVRLQRFDSLDSTSSEALRRLAAGTARHFDVVVARTQTAGRGRRGREWQSPPGNLYFTMVVMPPSNVPAGQLAFVAALGAGDAIRAVAPQAADLRYKWPNDLLLEGRKLGGILIEGSTGGKGEGLAIGIGINVAAAPHSAALPAIALADRGAGTPADDLLAPICARIAEWYGRWLAEGFPALRSAWLAHAHGLGEPVAVHLPDGSIRRGIFRDLDAAGGLVVEEADGGARTIAAGDVFFAAV